MYDGRPPATGTSGQQYFELNMLRDACSLTSVPPARSKLRQGGLVYSQFYASVKEVWDAAKQMPFANSDLEDLAIDPAVLQGARFVRHCANKFAAGFEIVLAQHYGRSIPRQRVWVGLGFCNTLPQYGYCWLEPRFKWASLAFRSDVTDYVLFGGSMLRGKYL
ncbi:hypothetical protein NA57DRAFT_50343 [Rhizodiscina lignyota]|uniref:Uncharacterized protein n=1 Tax=Rhizodiscina lignyota TaxID=1504668 RepID=A0A9P4I4M1_9PEZI|nr:hypothetical protein NA57DRAFT_50343 [Rhizodiscina lignyota]